MVRSSRQRINRPLLVSLVAAGLVSACTVPVTPVQTPDANVALTQELETYLEPDFGENLVVEYELLRDVPTQVGVALPKYYVWLTASQGTTVVVAGAARVAAEGEDKFAVLNFVSQSAIAADPEQLTRIFPAALIPDIEARAHSADAF